MAIPSLNKLIRFIADCNAKSREAELLFGERDEHGTLLREVKNKPTLRSQLLIIGLELLIGLGWFLLAISGVGTIVLVIVGAASGLLLMFLLKANGQIQGVPRRKRKRRPKH